MVSKSRSLCIMLVAWMGFSHPLSYGEDSDTSESDAQPGLSQQQIDEKMREIDAKLTVCRDEAEKSAKTELNGDLKFEFYISAEGKATRFSMTKNTVKNAKFKACALKTIKQFEYPKPHGGIEVRVSHSFSFK